MSAPVTVQATLEESMLVPGLSVRILRFQIAAVSPRFAFAWIRLVPICVMDRTRKRTRIAPIIDPTLVLTSMVLIGGIVLVRSALRTNARSGE